MAKRRGQRSRQLVVWLHVLTSVGWMSQALAMVSLMGLAATETNQGTRVAATSMARYLDQGLLAPLANASAFTGFLLAATTAWGFFRYWWVLAKFAITVVQLGLGIFVLSSTLEESVVAARAGTAGPVAGLFISGTLMASAIAFQAWLSIRKPWPVTPWAADRHPKPPTAPGWVFTMAATAVLVDLAVAVAWGRPTPVASAAALIVALVVRRRQVRGATRQPGVAATSPA